MNKLQSLSLAGKEDEKLWLNAESVYECEGDEECHSKRKLSACPPVNVRGDFTVA